ncbi:hypothetical protein B0H16DRAFT_1492396 [Mycena metata]|uniref:Uncharacterized protein n=1 Tax=Mycena metata TaxID=1033252 RepID=A0AAD7P1Y7_9AGAR|nr:hypothetical protein B0H16DRAFT_1492396 [Mycena metata]
MRLLFFSIAARTGNAHGHVYADAYALAEEFADEEGMDQLFTLPVFNRNHHGTHTHSVANAKNVFNNYAGSTPASGSGLGVGARAGNAAAQRHGKTDSVVSVRTENEINELIELIAPAASSSSAIGRSGERAQRTQMTDQMIMDAMYRSVVGKGNGNSAASSEDASDDDEEPLYDHAEETDAYDHEDFPTSSVASYESESEVESVPASPPNGLQDQDAHYQNQYLHPASTSGGRQPNAVGGGGNIAYHLPRRTGPGNVNIAPIDITAARSRGSTPSLMSSSDKSSVSSRTSVSVSTPPMSPDGSGGGSALLPSIEERFARHSSGSGGGLAYDDDQDEDEEDEDGEEYGYARYPNTRNTPAVHPHPRERWPTQKSRVEWIAVRQSQEQQRVEEDTGITVEPREPLRATAPAPAPSTPTRNKPTKPRTASPTPSDAETVSPRASGTFARILARKLGPTTPTSPMSPRSPLASPKSELFMDTKAKKAEEKRRKKEKVEELARTLKEREKKAKEDADRISDKQKERRMHMMEPVPMYGGFGMRL